MNAVHWFLPLALSRSALGVAAWVLLFPGHLLEAGEKQGPSWIMAAEADNEANLHCDPIYLLNHLFLGGPAPPEPFPACGASGVASDQPLGCRTPPAGCAH